MIRAYPWQTVECFEAAADEAVDYAANAVDEAADAAKDLFF